MYEKAQTTSQLDIAEATMEEIQSVAYSLLPRDWRLAQLNRIKKQIKLFYARDGRVPPANLAAHLDKVINDVGPSTRRS